MTSNAVTVKAVIYSRINVTRKSSRQKIKASIYTITSTIRITPELLQKKRTINIWPYFSLVKNCAITEEKQSITASICHWSRIVAMLQFWNSYWSDSWVHLYINLWFLYTGFLLLFLSKVPFVIIIIAWKSSIKISELSSTCW